ncbi:MAG: pimeloyl-ACP methyl ester carboxylesterase [Gammaproteobacteria bacterium]
MLVETDLPPSQTPAYADAVAFTASVEQSAKRFYTPMAGGRLAWHHWGGDASDIIAPLILLPGGFGSWRHWALNVGPLSEHVPLYVVELPGLGESDEVPTEGPEDIAQRVVEGIDAHFGAHASVDLAGFSFGGIIGGHVAARLGTRARSLAVIGSNALGMTIEKLTMRKRHRDMSEREVWESHRHNLATLMLADPARVDDLAIYLQVETTKRARARSGAVPHSDTLARVLPTVQCPINGIWGARDALVGRFMHERAEFFERLCDARFSLIEAAGHWAMYEAPGPVNDAILSGIKLAR